MSDVGYVTIYANSIAIMLMVGLMAILQKLRIRDDMEKKIFLFILCVVNAMSIMYIVCALRDAGVFNCSPLLAILIETVLELFINVFAFEWFIYIDYRMFHNVGHLRRNIRIIMIPFVIITLLDIINIFTGIMIYFDEDLVYHETPLYVIVDILRLGYFVASLFLLQHHKKRDRSMKFFSIRSFLIPSVFYVLLYYFTPYATVSLGISIGLTLICVEIVNEQCYLDRTTGFYNKLYLSNLREKLENHKYALNSVIIYKIRGGSAEKSAKLIAEQLPKNTDTIALSADTLITLSDVKDKGPLSMVSEDVCISFEEENIPVTVSFDLRKKTESGTQFLDRILRKA